MLAATLCYPESSQKAFRLVSAQPTSVAIIGAGIAGLTCARTLVDSSLKVTVFDKGRRPGGRMSTRQTDNARFDHGCQFLTGTDSRFIAALQEWHKANVLKIWNGSLVELDGAIMTTTDLKAVRYVGVSGIQSVCKDLAHGLSVRSEVEIKSVQRTETGWRVADADGHVLGVFDALVVATPPIQAANLLSEVPHLAAMARAVPMSPCWTVMASFSQPISFSADAAVVRNSALSWIAESDRQHAGNGTRNNWLLQATEEWSQQHLEESKPAVETALLRAFFEAVGSSVQVPTAVTAHRWRYAICLQPLSDGALADATTRIVVCGDWCLGRNAEAAYLSGLAAAGRLLQWPGGC